MVVATHPGTPLTDPKMNPPVPTPSLLQTFVAEPYKRSPAATLVCPVPPYTAPIVDVAPTTPARASSGPLRLVRVRTPAESNDDVAVAPKRTELEVRPPKKPVVEVAFANIADDVDVRDPSVRAEYRVEPLDAKFATLPIENIVPGEVVAMPRVLEKYDLPKTSKMLVSVAVALDPIMRTSEVSVV